MTWCKLGFWQRAAIGWSGFQRALWLAFHWFWPVMLVLTLLTILAAFGLYSLANAYGQGTCWLALFVALAPFVALKLLGRQGHK